MKFRRRRKAEGGINLTPLIDVVFLLLIFFMVSTTFTKETRLEITLPEAEGVASEQAAQQIDIVINREGSFQINGKPLINRDLETLIKGLKQESAGDSTLPVIITADANTPHQAVVTAMEAAGKLGFSKLNIATQKPQQEP